MLLVIAVSGPVGVGKSSFATLLVERFAATRLSTRTILLEAGVTNERAALQEGGDRLDRDTGGGWVADAVARLATSAEADAVLIVDSVRIAPQVDCLRAAFGSKVFHVHLTANDDLLAERYAARAPELKEFATYDEVRVNGTERAVPELSRVADVVVPVDRSKPDAVLARAIAGLGLFPREPERLVDVLVGAQYGSEGKGNICAHLAQDYDVLMRVGGPNAGHKVADPVYTYVQLPSGTGSNGRAKILVGAGATIWVPQMLKEINDLKLTPDRLSIDPQAMIIEPSDQELEGETLGVIGSTKQGVGAATARKVIGRDGVAHLGAKVRLARHAPELLAFLKPTGAELEVAYARGSRIMLEGTQGTDLSLHHGSYPHVTSRETTASGCLADAGIAPTRVRRVIMVTRTYPIRVGGPSGPMAGEIEFAKVAERSGLPLSDIEATEVGTISNKRRRMGEFDWEQLRRSAVLNGATDVALTFADYLDASNRDARRFEQLSAATREFVAEVERVANAPVSLIATRFHARGVIDRRTWR